MFLCGYEWSCFWNIGWKFWMKIFDESFFGGVGLQRYYMKSAREVARVMGVEKAPILNHYSETIAGAVTIRSFVQQEQFMAMNIHLFDNYSRPCFANIGLVEWIMFRMEFLCNLIFSLLMVLVLLLPDGVVSPSMLWSSLFSSTFNYWILFL